MLVPSGTHATAERRLPGRGALAAGAVLATVAAFLYRFLAIDFTNDHFVHLSRGWQILQGDVPLRDFFDPGLLFQYYASALALAWSGHNLFGEALLTVAFIAAGAGLTFLASAWLSRSLWVAALVTFAATVAAPRLYGYPKAFFYALAIVLAWRYAQRPGVRTVATLAAVTALAFLFRHDHGVYIALAAIPLVLVRQWGDWRAAGADLGRYAAIGLLLVSPFLVFVQTTTGLTRYVTGISPQVDRVSSVQFNRLPIHVDTSQPLLEWTPAPERRIKVRWDEQVDEATRRRLEREHGLTHPDHEEDTTWSYVLADDRRERLGALVRDPAVADTHGIDRGRLVLDVEEPFYVRVQRWLPLLRARVAPGVFTRENALAWFYYVTFLVPIVSLAVLAWRLRRGTLDRREAAVIAMAATLSFVIVQTLVRGSPDSRLADVANPIAILGAWLLGCSLPPPGAWRQPRALLRFAPAGVATLVTVWAVAVDASFLANLEVTRILTGPAGIWWRLGVVSERLRERPIDTWQAEAPGIPGLGRYVFACTRPDDRLFVTWFAPQIVFYAERPFAGGQVYLTANWHASPDDQRLTIERLRRERVPIVLERVDGEYPVRFPLVYEYVHAHYVDAPMHAEGMQTFRVLVQRNLEPTGTYEPLHLPCYR